MPHIHEKIDFTVEVFIVHKNKVLLRMHDKFKIWLSVGGHIELDEDPNEAAYREVKEEVELDIVLYDIRTGTTTLPDGRELIPPVSLYRHRVSPTHEHVTLGYFATSDTDQLVLEKPNDECRWVTKEELDEMELDPDIRFYAKRALEVLGK